MGHAWYLCLGKMEASEGITNIFNEKLIDTVSGTDALNRPYKA